MLMTSTGSSGRPETCLMISFETTFRVVLGRLFRLKKVMHQPKIVAIHRHEGFEIVMRERLIEDRAAIAQVTGHIWPGTSH